jgi:hypothetical protein
MKYLYNNSKFTKEDMVKGCQSPLTYFLDIPVLSFANHAKVKIGTIDLVNYKEYEMPIQIGSVIFRDFNLFREKGQFKGNHGTYDFIKANLQLIFINSRYNPIKYILKDIGFEYIRIENWEYFLNVFIPFINWGISKNKDVDLILLFSMLLCKKEILAEKKDLNHPYPYLSDFFLDKLIVKQYFRFESRVGRDDHAFESTKLIISSKNSEEFYFVKLVAKELAIKSFDPMITVKKNDDNIEISYFSMFDNNAFREPSREYSVEECNRYKKMLKNRHAEFYKSFWAKFTLLLDEYRSHVAKESNNWNIMSVYDHFE